MEDQVSEPAFWNDQEHARKVSQQLSDLKKEIEAFTALEKDAADLVTFAESHDASLIDELEAQLTDLEKRFETFEFIVLLSESYDEHNAILALHAGAGGVDAQDWTEILLRMFLRFAEQQGWRTKILDESRGEEAGIKSVMVQVEGRYAYGYLKNEAGVHRLVRISPFNADNLRHTSFALCEVLPELEELDAEIPIDEKELRIDTFMASGHGGQSVNTTYSAVRIVHIPTNITVSVQNERSQKQNKETAMKILRVKLHQIELQKQQAEKEKLRGEYHEAAWGNQIRSYVLHPYKLVKDHRTKFESNDPDTVLNGALLPFIEAELRRQAATREKQ